MKNKALSIVVLSLQYGLMANPANPQVTNGDVSFDSSTPGVLNIHASDRSIINWQDFSIDAGEMTQFFQPDVNSAVLNRVVSGNISSIMGSLQANGTVYLINPNGVIFGQDSVIDTGALLASTLDLPDQLFLQNGDLLFSGDSEEMLVNYGAIQASNGDVILIGYQVENNGTIDAPNGVAAVAAGREVLIRPLAQERVYIRLSAEDNTDLGINNTGDITALQAELKADGNAFSLAINHSGSIVATGMIEQGGKVFLVSNNGDMGVTGSIAASDGLGNGGEVGLFGGNIFMGQDGTVNVDGNLTGNGGTVMLLADGIANFYGSISAQGGAEGGDGGFIEVSGPVLDFAGSVCTMAPAGNTGMLLLDPNIINIVATGGTAANPIPYPPGGDLVNGDDGTNSPPTTSNIDVSSIQTLLMSNNVTIQSAQYIFSNDPEAGNINFMPGANLTWTSSNTLTVQADQDINVQANILSTGILMAMNPVGGSIILNAGGDINIGDPTGMQTTAVRVGSVGDTTFATTPVVALSAGGDLNVTAGSGFLAGALVGFEAPVVNCDITVTTGGSVILKGGANEFCIAAIGHGGFDNITENLFGNITFPIVKGDVILEGGTGGVSYAQIGHHTDFQFVHEISGDISMPAVQGAVNLTAGDAVFAFTLIGHGGYGAAMTSTMTGNIEIVADSFTLSGGDGTEGAFAAIGFTNGCDPGDEGGISVNPSAIDSITVIAKNDINLTAGRQFNSNASIGALFLNAVDSNTINVQSISVEAGGDININGSLGSEFSFALIGATSDPAHTFEVFNTVLSNVTVSAGGHLQLFGDTGSAQILNGDGFASAPNANFATDVTANGFVSVTAISSAETSIYSTGALTVKSLQGDIELISALTTNVGTLGSATIEGNGVTSVIAKGNILLNDGSNREPSSITTTQGDLTIRAQDDVTLNPSSQVSLGTLFGNLSIEAFSGDLNVLGNDFAGVRISNSTTGDLHLRAGNDVNFDQVMIRNTGVKGGAIGNFTIIAGNDLNVGTGTTTSGMNTLDTEVSQLSGEMALAAGGNLNVGSSDNEGHSIIGDYRTGTVMLPSTLNITVSSVLGSVNVIGGMGEGSFAQIGPNEISGEPMMPDVTGNLSFGRVVGSINLKAGMGDTCFAQIGAQGLDVIYNIDLLVKGNVILIEGPLTNSFAQIGSRWFFSISDTGPNVRTNGTISPPGPYMAPVCGMPYAVILDVNCAPVP